MSTETNATASTPATTTADGGQGRGHGRGRGDGRGRGYLGRRHDGRNGGATVTTSNFKGHTTEMNGHVFECFQEGTKQNQFAKTVEALGEYIAKNVKNPGDMMSITEELKAPEVPKPTSITKAEADDPLTFTLWKEEVSEYSKRKGVIQQNVKAIFAVIWGQCSESMKDKIKSMAEYQTKMLEGDCIWLLKGIKGIMMRFEGQRSLFLSLGDAEHNLAIFKQGPDMSLAAYKTEFENLVDVFEHYGGLIGAYPALQILVDKKFTDTLDRAKHARNQKLAMDFLNGADRHRFGTLWADLENQFARNNNQYPADLTEAYSMLVSYKPPFPTRNKEHGRPPTTTTAPKIPDSGTTLANVGLSAEIAGSNGVLHNGVTCFKCNHKGHYADSCPSTVLSGTQHLQMGLKDPNPPDFTGAHDYEFSFTQPLARHEPIPNTWILLDSQSTVCVFNNKHLLSNIRTSPRPLEVSTNGGPQISTLIGDIKNFGTVWYNPDSLANILSLAEVRLRCRCVMDTALEPAIHVHKSNGTIMTFTEYKSGLYFYDVASATNNNTNATVADYSFVLTVAGNKTRFHRRDIEGADKARDLYKKIGRPSQKTFEHILSHSLIRNCPVTVDDAKRAIEIYGQDIASLKGKSTKTPAQQVATFIPIAIPAAILKDHTEVTLCMDLFYVNKIPFFHTISRKLKVRTVSNITTRDKKTLLKETLQTLDIYHSRGFEVTSIHADMEFECIKNDLLPTQFDIAPNDAHVPEVERSIRTIKERVRADIHDMPYKRLPKLMIIELVRRAVKCLNQFPAPDGVSDTLSPFTIMTGKPNPDYLQMKVDFGAYVQVFEDNDPTNSTKSRRTGAIALNPTGNAQGDYHFMSLKTGRRLARRQWTVIPATVDVIDAVEGIAEREGQPLIAGGCPLFEWQPNHTINDEGDYVVDAEENENNAAINDLGHNEHQFGEGVLPADDYEEAPIEELDDDYEDVDHDNAVVIGDSGSEGANDSDDDGEEEEEEEGEDDGDGVVEGAHEDTPTEDEGAHDAIVEDVPVGDEHDGGAAAPRYNLRENRNRDYSHRFNDHQFVSLGNKPKEMPKEREGMYKYLVGHMMTQMTASAGIKKHGDKAVEALLEEFCQLDDKSVFKPLDAASLTGEQKKEALRAINLIKEKRCGRLKGRTCADGRAQRGLYTKEQTASPTVSTDALMMTLMIDALEQRDVATADVAGAYLHADMDDFVIIKLTGDTVDIMCKANKKYEMFATVEHGKRVLYLQLMKALYGCVRSALLWYELFTTTLQGIGFELNPYDLCVANKNIKGKQCTIVWYVDDTKISHVDSTVVTEVIAQIEEKFGKMTVMRGKEHTFLGMKITLLQDKTVKICMEDYVKEAIEDFQEDVTKGATTPANKNLFEIDPESPQLDKTQAERYHSVVAKLLYVAQRGRPDIILAVAFLCTRVSCSTDEDWRKLKRLMLYLNRTVTDFVILGADSLTALKTWVDAAYGVHHDMKSHTGGVISLGRGVIMCK